MKEWYLVLIIFNAEVERSQNPMTWDNCVLQAAYRLIEIQQYAASGGPIPEKYGGSRVTLSDVEVKCLR